MIIFPARSYFIGEIKRDALSVSRDIKVQEQETNADHEYDFLIIAADNDIDIMEIIQVKQEH